MKFLLICLAILLVVTNAECTSPKKATLKFQHVRKATKSTALTVPERKSTALTLYKPKTLPISSNPTSNNGGPRDNNFGMINLIKTNSGWLKINDNDNNNNNNNNINIPVSIYGSGNTIVLQLTLVNNNHNYNLN